ncbi:hypothetical protein ABEB36_011150 [Hypothenemus hampei]|uniref:Uncharacterized protein n=1 Tax=Hypothenemus hampei TaxID=57062 RepID=A0ABD1EEE6_HYPHA
MRTFYRVLQMKELSGLLYHSGRPLSIEELDVEVLKNSEYPLKKKLVAIDKEMQNAATQTDEIQENSRIFKRAALEHAIPFLKKRRICKNRTINPFKYYANIIIVLNGTEI